MPVYLHYLGVEVYGIIGFFVGIQAILSLLDLGISPTLTREIARLSAFPGKEAEMHDLSHTLEILCGSAAAIMTLIGLGLSPLVAYYWLRPATTPTSTVLQALMLMSITFAFQWITNFYSGGLTGLQRQKLYNVINCTGVVFRSAGTVFVLAFVSPTVQAFLIWQAAATLLFLIMMAAAYKRCLPLTGSLPKFRKKMLRDVWTYAAGMTGISIVSLILTQTDKIILSRMLTLENFGYYTLTATLAATAIGTITGSIVTAYFPKFSQMAAREDDAGLRSIYHRSSQVMSFILIPVTVITAVFSFEILLLWTRNEKIAENSWLLLTLLAIGTGLNGTMHLPYAMQLANGLTKLAFWQNVVAIILLIPLLFFAALRYGAVGAAAVWVVLNLFYVLVGMQVMHRFLLKGELKKWYLEDLGLPLAATLAGCLAFRYLFPHIVASLNIFIALGSLTMFVFLCSAMATAQIRSLLFARVNTLLGSVIHHK